MSQQQDFKLIAKKVYQLMMLVFTLFVVIGVVLVYYMMDPNFSAFKESPQTYAEVEPIDEDLIENGVHLRTGLVEAEGLMTVVNNCTSCHSAKLVTQNRMSAERWNATIRWMQQTQNLWDLGPNQEIIVNYLVTNYPVQDKGRRESLTNIQWYDLED
jgi:hypothetical protein